MNEYIYEWKINNDSAVTVTTLMPPHRMCVVISLYVLKYLCMSIIMFLLCHLCWSSPEIAKYFLSAARNDNQLDKSPKEWRMEEVKVYERGVHHTH